MLSTSGLFNIFLFCFNWFLSIIALPKLVNMPLDSQPILKRGLFLLDYPEVAIITENEFMSLPGDDLLNLWRGSPKGQLQGEKGRLPLHRKEKVWNSLLHIQMLDDFLKSNKEPTDSHTKIFFKGRVS